MSRAGRVRPDELGNLALKDGLLLYQLAIAKQFAILPGRVDALSKIARQVIRRRKWICQTSRRAVMLASWKFAL